MNARNTKESEVYKIGDRIIRNNKIWTVNQRSPNDAFMPENFLKMVSETGIIIFQNPDCIPNNWTKLDA